MSLQKVFNDEIQLRFDEISNKLYNFKHSFDLFIKKLLGKCLGFAPRSESFAIEPSVQVCSISSLSEFRFAQYVRKSAGLFTKVLVQHCRFWSKQKRGQASL